MLGTHYNARLVNVSNEKQKFELTKTIMDLHFSFNNNLMKYIEKISKFKTKDAFPRIV